MSRTTFDFLRRPFARELLIFLGFCALTSVMTWPWILHLRDAVADKGDPYMIAWTLWWDFHQTFHHPLHLFDANVFYPYRYTLAFSENDYGIALLFFPLFAIGLRPLTVHAIATFSGFAFSGYGSFRLTRTLTGSLSVAWLAGIIFAFIPYRFHLLSHLHYLFAGWLPLVCEALILFSRQRTWKRATWLGVAFLLNALSCLSWFIMALVPLGFTFLFLLFATKGLIRDRTLWLRGAAALGGALLLLSPFLFVYHRVSVLYGLRWQPWEFTHNSASLLNWFKSDPRNKLWHNLGTWIPGGSPLFPGLLAPCFALVALSLRQTKHFPVTRLRRYAIVAMDCSIVLAAVVAAISIAYQDVTLKVFGLRLVRLNQRSITHALLIIVAAAVLRFSLLNASLWGRSRMKLNLTDELDRLRGQSGIAIGLIWMVWGFLASLGPNFFLYRWLLDYVPLFQSIRFPARTAMICFVGLSVLGGIGGAVIADRIQCARPFKKLRGLAVVVVAAALLFELRAAPLYIDKGEVEPSALALRLKHTPMSGGIVELPSEAGLSRHFYMLRAADHERPLVNATSSFISPITDQINRGTQEKIDPGFMDLLEQIPASFLVIHNDRMSQQARTAAEHFVLRQAMFGRLRFVNRFDGAVDLYAVVKNEPGAESEGPLPIETSARDWGNEIRRNPLNLLLQPAQSQTLYRVLLTAYGRVPRYFDFLNAAKDVAAFVNLDGDEEADEFAQNLQEFANRLVQEKPLRELDNRGYVKALITNTKIPFDNQQENDLLASLDHSRQSRAELLLQAANDQGLTERENDRSLLVLHYFAYLRRNPDDPPDHDLRGFNFWLQQLARSHDSARLAEAFQNSIEYHSIKERQQ
jgi:hypothetical protein